MAKASKFYERRCLRSQLQAYLESRGWTGMNWAEGFSSFTLEEITIPFISVFLDDMGRASLQMGRTAGSEEEFKRRAQITVFMESEDRVNALTDDISDFLDTESIVVMDNASSVLGSMVSSTESISTTTLPPNLDTKELEWTGNAVCMYEVFYP
jgi:hypothetical protein